jgi:hypothetical protein
MVNYWIFQGNEKYYRIDKELEQERLPENEREKEYVRSKYLWPVTRYKSEIRNGDIAFLWVTFPGSRHDQRGIFATLDIISDPESRSDNFRKYWRRDEDAVVIKPRVEYRYTRVLNPPLFESEIKKTNGLSNLSICWNRYSHEGTNFRVTPKEGEIILREIDSNH